MLVIVKGRPIEIDWYIFKGANKQAEDFSQLDAGSIKVFLIGPSNKGDDQISRFNRFTYKVNVATDDNNKQYLKINIDDTASALLDTGIYDIKVVWVKNSELHLGIREGNQHLSESRLSGIFAITADSSEDNTRLDSGVTAKKILRSFVEPTGYDGLSAYEIAVMHGYTEDEQTWAEEFTEAEERVDYEMDETKAGDGSTTRNDEKHIPVEEWVHESWAHKVEVTWQGNESTRQSNESTRQDNEDTRKSNEGIGTTDAECAAGSRRKNESIRVSNESTRQSQEGTRQDNETTRGQKETARQKAEGQLGDTDPDYATSRVKKELDRQSAESTRISNEEGRVAAEGSVEGQTGRAYAESVRVSNESTRQSNEGSRGTAETARQKAEGQLGSSDPDYATSRIKQELDRQTAEAARELAETARENAKISSTTIEYAVGDSGTTAPVSGWQSTIPSYTTGDFLWGRTTITFGDGTSKVLYAIGSVPDVAVSQNASTGKTTITVGSDSYDVATEPVSVSQNTETGKKELLIGGEPALIVDNEPEAGSDNLVKSGGVFDFVKVNSENSGSSADLDISDKENHILARFKSGHILTEKFNSEDIEQRVQNNTDALLLKPASIEGYSDNIDFVDANGNVGARLPIGFDGSKEFTLPYIIVDKNGHGKYTSITQASASEPADTVFLIMPGVYEDEVVDCRNKRQYFIGVDREHVIVRNYIGDYDYPPFNIASGLLKNMTIIAAAEDGVDVSIRSTETIADRGVYAVHSDWHTASNDEFTIDNCTLISDWYAAWGIGLRGGCHMYGRNSRFTSNYGYGMLCHDNDWNIAQYDGEQYLHIIDCVIHSTDGVYPALMLNSRARNDEVWVRNSIFYIEMIKTLLKSEGDAPTYQIGNGYPVVIGPDDFLGLKNGRQIDTSWGNSESDFNA